MHAERQPRLTLAARDRLERRAVDLGDERAVEQHERDHARLEDREVDPEEQRHAEVDPDHAHERRHAAEDVDVDRREPRQRRPAHPREREQRARRRPRCTIATDRRPRARSAGRAGSSALVVPDRATSRTRRERSEHRRHELLRARVRAVVEEAARPGLGDQRPRP